LSFGQPGLQAGAVEPVGRDRLLDEQQRLILGELQVALRLREAHDLAVRAVQAQLRRLEDREQGLVAREDRDQPQAGSRRDHLDLLVEHLPLGREHLRWEPAVAHASAASRTWSIVPFRKNALSGTSSSLPSMISSNPRIVSAIGT